MQSLFPYNFRTSTIFITTLIPLYHCKQTKQSSCCSHKKKSHKQELYVFISSNHLNNISVTFSHAPFSLNISAGSITEFNSLLQISMLRFFYAWNYMYLRVFCSMYILMYPQNHFFLIIIGTILVTIFNTIIFKIS